MKVITPEKQTFNKELLKEMKQVGLINFKIVT
jgi:hypothetical protein